MYIGLRIGLGIMSSSSSIYVFSPTENHKSLKRSLHMFVDYYSLVVTLFIFLGTLRAVMLCVLLLYLV